MHSRRQVKAEGDHLVYLYFVNLELVLEFALGDSPGLKWQVVAVSFITVLTDSRLRKKYLSYRKSF